MALASDYFLLYHGVPFEVPTEEDSLDFGDMNEERVQSFALLLMISRKVFDNFSLLNAFEPFCRNLHISPPKALYELYTLQYRIIRVLESTQRREVFQTLQETFAYLLEEEILSKENYKKLLSLFSYREASAGREKSREEVFSFSKEREAVLGSIEALQVLLGDPRCAVEVKHFLETQKFSIGITGVMNSGKSTLINALMGKALLGTSVVPETASLTVLTFSETPSATVVYWNQREWQDIVDTSEAIDVMKEFVAESTRVFGDALADYILEHSREEEVPVSDLPLYTSAEHSDRKCNLVKNVVLKTDLSFLKEGVEIVDTPGLDDPVIQREEITRSYIGASDMLLHLMNVSQSATQTDVRFIIDALVYQNITKLLIVITRADTVSASELDEVIAYTKASLTAELKRQNRESRLDDILESIRFFAISGKTALTCRTDPEKAREEGLTLEKSGILALEEELSTTLFGADAPKSQLIIRSAKNQLLTILREKRFLFDYRLELASKDKEELLKAWEDFLTAKEERLKRISVLHEALQYEDDTLKSTLRSLLHFIHSEFYTLQEVVRERVVSDVRYSYEKRKRTPEPGRIEVIVQTAFKDGIIDIVRDCRYTLLQDLEALDEKYALKFKNADLKKENVFEAEDFFGDAFQTGFLIHNIDLSVEKIQHAVKHSKAKEMTMLDAEIKVIVKEMFAAVERDTGERVEALALKFTDQLISDLGKTLVAEKNRLEQKEESLKSYLDQADDIQSGHAQSSLDIHTTLKRLEEIENGLKGASNV